MTPHLLVQDLRYGIRTLSRTPAFTAVAVAVLALGIAANALAHVFAPLKRRRKDLDGDDAVEAGITGAIHLADAAGPERRDDLVRAEPCSWSESHGRGSFYSFDRRPRA